MKGCWLYLFSDRSENSAFPDYQLEFEYYDGKMIKERPQHERSVSGSLTEDLPHDGKPHFLLSHFLYVGDEFIGFLLIEPGQTDIRIMRILSKHISIALNGIILFERLDQSYRKLMEQAHKKGMADTTGILHNIANIMNSVNIYAAGS